MVYKFFVKFLTINIEFFFNPFLITKNYYTELIHKENTENNYYFKNIF